MIFWIWFVSHFSFSAHRHTKHPVPIPPTQKSVHKRNTSDVFYGGPQGPSGHFFVAVASLWVPLLQVTRLRTCLNMTLAVERDKKRPL